MLSANSLSIRIKDTTIVKDLSFDVDPGEFVGIIGPNGSGKTTLLKSISGILPFQGKLTLNNKSLTDWHHRELASHLAVVKQNTSIQFDFTVLDFILLGRLPHKSWLENISKNDHEVVENIISMLKLHSLKDRLITTLSGGERQRVLLAQALAQDPELLLLDEPTANLDIYYQLDFLNHVRTLTDEGLTVIAVFHDIAQAAQFADKILVLKEGKQIDFGPSKEILTPDLLERVFYVKSEIARGPNNRLHIQYLNTI